MNKPYNLFPQTIVNTKKGTLDGTYRRFIGPGDSIFALFIRSLGYRHTSPFEGLEYEYVIYDKNPKHMDMFRDLLEWDGITDIEDGFETFNIYLDKVKNKHGISTRPFPRNSTLGLIMRHGFNDFKTAWDYFRTSKFTFIDIDVIKQSDKFIDEMAKLKTLDLGIKQFVKFDFNRNHYTKSYERALNDVLHFLWLRSFKNYTSVIELSDLDNNQYEDFAGKIYARMNPTTCILPWMHVQYKPTGQSKLCCRYDTVHERNEYDKLMAGEAIDNPDLETLVPLREQLTIQKSTIERTFKSNYWSDARSRTENSTPITGCHKCYKEEQASGEVPTSMRLGSSILYNNGYLHRKPNYPVPKLEFLEIGFGNYCNLACLSCNSTLSTTWHNDELALNEIVTDDVGKLKRSVYPKLDNLQFRLANETFETLNLIKFTGGEPMINPEFIKFIEDVCTRGKPENISLEIYTNCSYIPSPKLLTDLIKFKNIQLNLSIDGYGVVNDYMRFGSQWTGEGKQTVDKAIDHWLELGKNNKNINVIMSTTLSVMNILEMPKLMPWWISKFKDSGNEIIVGREGTIPTIYDGFFKIQPAYDPFYINLDILPKEYYEEVAKWCETFKENFDELYPDIGGMPECIRFSVVKIAQLISKSKGNKDSARYFKEYTARMDKIRGNSLEKSLPELSAKLNDYLSKNAG
jgi:sulfatase maturation enzyme AslB (radical SAM superfamily)